MSIKKVRCYEELILLKTFKERFQYLELHGMVGQDTFGFDRYLNQRFYNSAEWKKVRDMVIARDLGCDLGMEGHDIYGKIIVHHMNPMLVSDLSDPKAILDMNHLICVSHDTHNAIHYGTEALLAKDPIQRKPNDMCPWKK